MDTSMKTSSSQEAVTEVREALSDHTHPSSLEGIQEILPKPTGSIKGGRGQSKVSIGTAETR
jgi:hypothetical protein